MRKLLHFTALLLITSLLSSCRTHKKTYTHAHKIEIDSIDLRKLSANIFQSSALDAHIIINDWSFVGTDTTSHKQIVIDLKKRDTASTHFSQIDSLALQSHEIDSVVQVSTTEPKTQQSANKCGFWACLKTFAFFLAFALMVLCGFKAKKLLHL